MFFTITDKKIVKKGSKPADLYNSEPLDRTDRTPKCGLSIY